MEKVPLSSEKMANSTEYIESSPETEGELDVDGETENQNPNQGAKHQENLLTRVVSFDHKSYYLDVRENSRGKYLKLTESSERRRNTILLSGYVISVLQTVLEDGIKENYTSKVKTDELDTHWVTVLSRRVMNPNKKLYIDLMQNKRGRSLNIAEISLSRPKTSVVISERLWFPFRRALEEITEKFPELKKSSSNGGGSTSASGSKTIVQEDKNKKNNKEISDETKGSKLLLEKRIQLSTKKFFFDLLENELGRYSRMSEVRKGTRETVYMPSVSFGVVIELLTVFLSGDFETDVDGAPVLPLPNLETEPENHKTLSRREVKIEGEEDSSSRTYNFDLRENSYGRFLRLTESRTKPGRSNCVFLPGEALKEVKEVFQEFIDFP